MPAYITDLLATLGFDVDGAIAALTRLASSPLDVIYEAAASLRREGGAVN